MRKLLILLLLCSCGIVNAQEVMKVRRAAAIDRNVAIRNIYVNESGNRWVADTKGVFLVQSPEFANPITIDATDWSLLSAPDGNEELKIPRATLEKVMGRDFSEITTAQLDRARNELYIGTKYSGVYHFKTQPQLQLIDQLTTKNTKLRSNTIQTIFVAGPGKVWIGTYDGLLEIEDGKDKVHGKYFSIEAIDQWEGKVWVVSDGEVLEMDRKGDFYGFEIETRMVEGQVKDLAFDSRGRLWIASEIVVRYNFDTEGYDLFGPAQEYTSQFVNCIAVDQDDALWVGTKDKGVYYIGKAVSMTAELIVETPLDCQANAKNASLKVLASGGQPPYNYQWSGGLQGENPKGLSAGTYTVTITDKKGLSIEAQKVIKDNSLDISISQQKPAGQGGRSDGHALVSVKPANARYNYQWDNGEQTSTAKQLNVGEHKVTVTGDNGCTTVATVTITEALSPLAVNLEQTKTNDCHGAESAEIVATTSGGQGPYTYQWSEANLKGAQATRLAAGTYALTVTDASGNTANASIAISAPNALKVTITPKSPATTNMANGRAKATAEGGNGNFSFKWDTGEITETAEKLAPGTHTVTVTDAKGCTATAAVDINENVLPLSVELITKADIKCAGDNTAALVAEVSGGKEPFQYQWSTEKGNGTNANNLTAGNYQININDAAGNTTNAKITINQPEALTATITPRSPANTNQADGKAKVSAKGGSGKYTYQWDTGESGETAEKLAAGKHTVTITDEAGCTTTASVDVSEDILPLAVELVTKNEIECAGGSTASLTAEISGGKGPFQYQWSTDKGNAENATGLAAGNYQITVTDAAGNNANAQLTVSEPQPLTADITPRSPANTNQADGKAKVNAKGGSGKYTYQWDTGESGETAEKLAAGTHTVTITDEAGCSTTASVDVSEDILPLAVELINKNEIDCAGGSGASLVAEISGGKGPFQYQWSTDKGNGESANGLAAGNYQITVSDAAGNTANAKLTVNEPQPLTVTITPRSPANTNQADGKAKVSAKGGTGKYSYQWDTGENGETAEKLAAGKHTVTVTDGAGCTSTATIEVSEDILPLNVELVTKSEIQCAGESSASLTAEISGGKGPFQYQWSTDKGNGENASGLAAGNYGVTITDAAGTSKSVDVKVAEPGALTVSVNQTAPASTNGSDGRATAKASGGSGGYTFQWDSGENTADASNLIPGQHKVTVTDKNGCSATGEINITENILAMSIDLKQTAEINCAGEQTAALQVEVKGGKAPYQFAWNNSAVSGEQAANLGPGEYAVTVTDASGLTQQDQLSIAALQPLSVEIANNKPATNEDSEDGRATLNITGGTPAYVIKWDNEEIGDQASELAFGPHTVTVTDAKGCSKEVSFETGKKILPDLTAGRLRAGQTLQVSQVYFEADSTNVTTESYPVLNEIAEFLEENPLVVIEVGGHTNNQPPHEFCDRLSSARAKSAALYIVQQGIDPQRVVYKGYGKREPKYSNATADGRRKNQRVEVKILRLN